MLFTILTIFSVDDSVAVSAPTLLWGHRRCPCLDWLCHSLRELPSGGSWVWGPRGAHGAPSAHAGVLPAAPPSAVMRLRLRLAPSHRSPAFRGQAPIWKTAWNPTNDVNNGFHLLVSGLYDLPPWTVTTALGLCVTCPRSRGWREAGLAPARPTVSRPSGCTAQASALSPRPWVLRVLGMP